MVLPDKDVVDEFLRIGGIKHIGEITSGLVVHNPHGPVIKSIQTIDNTLELETGDDFLPLRGPPQ